jgi:hypothetical protein
MYFKNDKIWAKKVGSLGRLKWTSPAKRVVVGQARSLHRYFREVCMGGSGGRRFPKAVEPPNLLNKHHAQKHIIRPLFLHIIKKIFGKNDKNHPKSCGPTGVGRYTRPVVR